MLPIQSDRRDRRPREREGAAWTRSFGWRPITGIPGFPARSFIKAGEEAQPADGEWHDTPDGVVAVEGEHELRTKSSATISGTRSTTILSPAKLKSRRSPRPLDRIMTHILDNDYPADWALREADAVGMVGARPRSGRSRRNRAACLQMLSHLAGRRPT